MLFTYIYAILFRFRAALNLDLAEQEGKAGVAPEVPPGPPVSDATFRSFLNKVISWRYSRDFELPCPGGSSCGSQGIQIGGLQGWP